MTERRAGEAGRPGESEVLPEGQRVRPLGLRFHVFLGVLTLGGLAFLVGSIVFVLDLAPSPEWEDAPRLARLAFGLFSVGIASYLLVSLWGTKLHVAVRLTTDVLAYWDWRNRVHEVGWDEVTRVDWDRAYKRICKWHLTLQYLPRYSLERRTRWLRLPTADGWRPEIAEALRDEIVARSGLQLVEGDPDQEGDRVWRRPEA